MSFFFIQMADPQFGMFAFISGLTDEEVEERKQRGIDVMKAPRKFAGFEDETRLYTRAIESANRLKPAFVVMCGDMTHNSDDEAQLAEIMRITNTLDHDIPMHWVAGNHDVGDAPTHESLALYRSRFGKDNYSFDHAGSHFVVINSGICFDPTQVPDEWNTLLNFLKDDLVAAREKGCDDIVVFTHHPLFLDHPEEGDGYFVIPRVRRSAILDLLESHGVAAVFAGHLHRNNYASHENLEMVTTGAVGYPLGDDPSGLRIVKMQGGAIEHEYFGLDALPGSIKM